MQNRTAGPGFIGTPARTTRRGDTATSLVLAGFSVSVVHESTWTLAPVCYLEDLFVAPKFRSRGIGRLLIQDLVDRAKSNGWSRLYWHTRASNPARRLYDEFAKADDFVRYRRTFPETA